MLPRRLSKVQRVHRNKKIGCGRSSLARGHAVRRERFPFRGMGRTGKRRELLQTVVLAAGTLLAADARAGDAFTTVKTGVGTTAQEAGLSNQSVGLLLGKGISTLITISGIVLVVYFLWGGYLYLLSQGEQTKVSDAKKTMSHAVIGIVIVLASYAIAQFVLERLSQAVVTP